MVNYRAADFCSITPASHALHLTAEAPGVETQAVGQAIFKVNKDGQSVDYKIIVAQLDDITMAHIHWQPGGGDAPPVVWLLPSDPPPTLIPGTTNWILVQGTFTTADFVGNLAGQSVSDLLAIFRAVNLMSMSIRLHTQAVRSAGILTDLCS